MIPEPNNESRKFTKKRSGLMLGELISELQDIYDEHGDVVVYLTELGNGDSGVLEHIQFSPAHTDLSDLNEDIVELVTRRMDVDVVNGLMI